MQNNLSQKKDYEKLYAENVERIKELAAINKTTAIFQENKPVEESIQQVCSLLPSAWQYPDYTCARIRYGSIESKTKGFIETKWRQYHGFETLDSVKGSIEVYYTKEFRIIDEGPFLNEERHLIKNLSEIITGYLNSRLARELMMKVRTEGNGNDSLVRDKSVVEPGVSSKKLLQTFLNKNNYDRDIYHDLMPFKVKEILLVATLYDAYSIEKEGRFSEYVLGEYSALNLTSVPRITGVSSLSEAKEELSSRHFDLVIIMMGVEKQFSLEIAENIKSNYPYIPVFLLLNNNKDLTLIQESPSLVQNIDKVFIWNGEPKIFFAMIKHVEDLINTDNDTRIGLVRVILLVEDNPIYYSRYLPILYDVVMEQTRHLIDDVSTDELYKVLRLRARPKILLAHNYEEAINIINNYKEYLLCLITDVEFERKGTKDEHAGFRLADYAKRIKSDLPTVIQSSDPQNAEVAYALQATYIDKNSDSLKQDFKSFITHYLGFGNFVYRDKSGRQIGQARSLKEFETQLRRIPDESLLYHARKDHFSMWLMARGEIQAAKILNHQKVTDFENSNKIRDYMLEVIHTFRNEQDKGKVIPFAEDAVIDETNIISLAEGSLGGKGRGLAFINTLINNLDFSHYIPNINIRTPKTAIIGVEEFETFLNKNELADRVLHERDYTKVKSMFLEGNLSKSLIKKLKVIVKKITKPLAVRSSGLFEDSMMQPFAGIFETYYLPNNHPDQNVRLQQLMDAIKLVYASVYSDVARQYVEAVNYKIEQERMAVVIQELVGNRFGNVFYPHISGVAQSYNYYPVAHMKPEEGFGVIAIGLGKYVVEGEKCYRFSPLYPDTEISSQKDQFKNSQTEFFALDLKSRDINLLEGETAGLVRIGIDDAERQGTLKHLASVYDPISNRIIPGLTHAGPRIVNFANILKYNYIPLAKTIEVVLNVVEEALGNPVEIEFAVDLTKDSDYRSSFYLLQIKPLLGSRSDFEIDREKIDEPSTLLFTEKAMGNGMIDNISDVIYIDIENFDKAQTPAMVEEINHLNEMMIAAGKKYILIGPGRWGTRDRYIGIPVKWPQISNAKVIVETSLEGYPMDASSGSHFFHNVTSMQVGYFSIKQELSGNYIKWDILDQQEIITRTKYFKHIKFQQPLKVKMDGKSRFALIEI